MFQNNTFTFNNASLVWPITPLSMTIATKGMGGAVFYECPPSANVNCSVTFYSNTFCNNTAQDEGGAILWANTRYNNGSDGNENTFCENNAPYGHDVGSSAVGLKIDFISSND